MKIIQSLFLTVAMVVGLQAQTSVSINNYSFENPGNADGDYGASASIGSGGGTVLTQNTSGLFTGDTGSGTPQGADGANISYYNGIGNYSVDVGASFLSGQDYTFTLAIGNRTDLGLPDWRIGIGGVSLTPVVYTSGNGTHAASGTFSDASVTITSAQIASNSLVGTNIGLWIELTGQGSASFSQLNFDNLRLSYVTAIPEPSTYVLFAFSAMGLFYIVRKNKKYLS